MKAVLPQSKVCAGALALPPQTDRIIRIALEEDLADVGDITAGSIVPADAQLTAIVLLKEPAVVAGLAVFEKVLKSVDQSICFEAAIADGIRAEPGPVAHCRGPARAILAAERTALNLLQRLSGIATITARYVELAAPLGIEIRDTRKTTPGLRALEKWAVRIAGGTNHRFGLFDQFLIKDNHIRIAGITESIRRARAAHPGKLVEVEVTCTAELVEALAGKPDIILLDNMSPEQVRQAVALVAKAAFIEVSGGINAGNIKDYLIPGVNAISIGALTHSVKSVDISLEVEG